MAADPASERGCRAALETRGSKYRTDGNVWRGPSAVANVARCGGRDPSMKATALLVVPKSRPSQRGALKRVLSTRHYPALHTSRCTRGFVCPLRIDQATGVQTGAAWAAAGANGPFVIERNKPQ